MDVESIRIMEEKLNLNKIIQAITALHGFIGGSLTDINSDDIQFLDTKSKYGSLLKTLCDVVIDHNTTTK